MAPAEVASCTSDETSDLFLEEGSISRTNSTEIVTLPDGMVEERFRVDRRKLEAMILRCPPDPCDLEITKLPIGEDGKILAAEDFFNQVMQETETDIKYPRSLKVGARNKKDPHVRITGPPDAVARAGFFVRQELEPQNKITMKLDVSWTHHSHIIGKGGNTIQPVVKRTGVSIHFPDGNKNSETKKSNQVSLNSRGDDLRGLEDARASIRKLTPLTFTFILPATAQFIIPTDFTSLVSQVQNTYEVQVDLKVNTDGPIPTIMGSVRGAEWDETRVKEATLCVLQGFCGCLANQMQVQMTMDISPQHHTFVLGRNGENLKKIMQKTATTISFPDGDDHMVPPLKRSAVVISGAINNVYLARQNLMGLLPLVLMFDLKPNQYIDQNEVAQIMQTLDVQIVLKTLKEDGCRPIIIKGAERNANFKIWVENEDSSSDSSSTPSPTFGHCKSSFRNCCWDSKDSSFIPSGEDSAVELSSNSLSDISSFFSNLPDKKAPGYEKQLEKVFKQLSLADYNIKQAEAMKAMKQPVSATNPRFPTNDWAGYGLSRSMPYQGAYKQKEDKSEISWLCSPSSSLNSSDGSSPANSSSQFIAPKSNYMDFVSAWPRMGLIDDYDVNDLETLLTNLEMARYIDLFNSQGVDLNLFLTLEDNDLKEVGVSLFGHRKKLLLAIKSFLSSYKAKN